jgi:predicted hotdog family 3-hydroxylacyl-ACP dehydratase
MLSLTGQDPDAGMSGLDVQFAAVFLPHQLDSVLLDEIWQKDEATVVASVRPTSCSPFTGSALVWPDWMVIELMAQTIAAGAGLRELRPGRRAQLGLLLGVRDFVCPEEPPMGKPTLIEAFESTLDANGMGVYDCVLSVDDVRMASAVLTVFLPESIFDYLGVLDS